MLRRHLLGGVFALAALASSSAEASTAPVRRLLLPHGSQASVGLMEWVSNSPLDPIPWSSSDPVPGDNSLYGFIPRGQTVLLKAPTALGSLLCDHVSGVLVTPSNINGSPGFRRTAFKLKAVIRNQHQVNALTGRGDMTGTDGLGNTFWYCLMQYDPDATNLLELAGYDVCRGLGYAHSSSTFENVQCAAGWYGASASGPVSAGAIVNNSVRTIREPEVHQILPFEKELEQGSTRRVEFIVRDRYGQHGRNFDLARVRGRDQSGNFSAWVNVTSTTLFQVGTTDLWEEHCVADISLAGLNAEDEIRIEIEVFGLIGTGAVSSVAYEADPKDPRSTTTFINDKNGTYGGVSAVLNLDPAFTQGTVGPGNNLAGIAGEYDFSTAAHLNTIFADCKTFNTSTKSGTRHADIGGIIIYVKNTTGAPLGFKPSATISTANTIGKAAWYFKPHPSNNAPVYLQQDWGSTFSMPARMILDGVDWKRANTTSNLSANQSQAGPDLCAIGIRKCTVDLPAAGTKAFYGDNWDRVFMVDIKFTSAGAPTSIQFGLSGSGSTLIQNKVAWRIWNATGSQANFVPYTFGGFFGQGVLIEKLNAGGYSQEGLIAAFMMSQKNDTQTGIGSAQDYYLRGAWIDNWVIEWLGTSITGVAMVIGGDGTTKRLENVNLRNIFMAPDLTDPSNNTFNRGRVNNGYNDTAGAHGIVKEVRKEGLWTPQQACKHDQFTPTAGWSAGRVACWETWLGAEDFCNGIMINRDPEGASGRGSDAFGVSVDNDPWAGFVRSVGSKYDTGPIAVVNNKCGLTSAVAGHTAVGGGTVADYQPSGVSNPIYATSPAGHQRETWDLMGNARRTDGTGVHCAIERA